MAKRTLSVDPNPRPRIPRSHQSIRAQETADGLGLDDLLPILRESSADLRGECTTALGAAIDWLQRVNSHRWSFERHPKAESAEEGLLERRQQIADLKRVIEDYRANKGQQLLQPFRKLFDPKTGKLLPEGQRDAEFERSSIRPLFVCFVFSTNMASYSTALVSLLELLRTSKRGIL